MIFLTVGTQFPFDRLVKAVDEALDSYKINEPVFAQIGQSSYLPKNFPAVTSLVKNTFDNYMNQASAIISHAGMGTMAMALDKNKPLLVMPRKQKFDEVVNDHQLHIAEKFEKLDHILVAYEPEQIPDKIKKLRSFIPQPRNNNTDTVIQRINEFLSSINSSKQKTSYLQNVTQSY